MVRKRPDAGRNKIQTDEAAKKQYKKLLLLRSDPKLALTEGVAELRKKAMEVAKIPALDEDELARTGKADIEKINRVQNARIKELASMRQETRKQKREQNKIETPMDKFQTVLKECEIYSSSKNDGKVKRTPVKLARMSSTQSTPGTARTETRSDTDEEDDDEEGLTRQDSMAPSALSAVLASNPPYLGGTLRQYQKDGVKWLLELHNKCLSGILADEMGLGKTFQTIALLSCLKYSLKIPGPHLVLCPRSVLGNWNRECARWSPGLEVFVYHATKNERRALNLQLKETKADVILSTWEQVTLGLPVFSKLKLRYLILDEGHKIKNEGSIIARNVRKLNCTNRLLLTGTPLQNNLSELWALLNFLLPRLFADKASFDNWFDAASGNSEQKVMDHLHLVLRPFMLRRIKSEADASIPPKKEVYISCKLSRLQRVLYQNILAKDAEAFDGEKQVSSLKNLRNIVMHLRKVCNHPFLFEGIEEGPPFVTDDKLVKASGKMIILDKLLGKLLSEPKETRQKILIFSQMTRALDILSDYIEWRGWKFCRLDGSTSGEDRDLQMNDFNSPNTDKEIFILSTRAGGLGINLQAASTVILFDSDWNPQADLQAMDRAHRIGQKRPVTVFRFITDNTIEERMYHRAMKKLYLDALVVQQGNMATRDDKLSSDEMRGMIRWGAAAIFKNENEDIEDVDIDKVIEMGAKRMTKMQEEAEKQQQTNLKSFNLGVDEGNVYQFEGVDYSSKPTRSLYIEGSGLDPTVIENDFKTYGQIDKSVVSPSCDKAVIMFRQVPNAMAAYEDLNGKKIVGSETPVVLHYGSQTTIVSTAMKVEISKRMLAEEAERKRKTLALRETKQPTDDPFKPYTADHVSSTKGPRLPVFKKRPPFQFYDEDRLEELHDLHCAAILQKHNGEPVTELTAAQISEREQLENEGFTWAFKDLMAFINASAILGREAWDKIAVSMEKDIEEVTRYGKAFWEKGPHTLEKFEMYRQKIDKAEEGRQQASSVHRTADEEIFSKMKNPWSPLVKTCPSTLSVRPLEGDEVNINYPKGVAERYALCYAQQTGNDYALVKKRLETSQEIFFDISKSRSVHKVAAPAKFVFASLRNGRKKRKATEIDAEGDDESDKKKGSKKRASTSAKPGGAKKRKT